MNSENKYMLSNPKAVRVGAKLRDDRWENDEQFERKLAGEALELGEDLALWLKQNFYASLKSKHSIVRFYSLNCIGAVGVIGAENVLKSEIIDDTFIQDIIRLAEGGKNEKEQKLEVPATFALIGLEIARKQGKYIPIILKVLKSKHNKRLINNIVKLPCDEKIIEVLISILPDEFLMFRQEGMKTIISYSTSYWVSSALLKIGDERGIEAIVYSTLQKFSKIMENKFNLAVESNVRTKYYDFLIGAGKPVVKYLVQGLSQDNRQALHLATYCLGKLGDHSAFEALVRNLDSDVAGLTWRTTEALGNLGDRRAIPFLLPLLGSKIPGVFSASKKSLIQLKNHWQASEFINVLNNENEKVVLFAIDILRNIKDQAATKPLSILLESENKKIQKATKKALKTLK